MVPNSATELQITMDAVRGRSQSLKGSRKFANTFPPADPNFNGGLSLQLLVFSLSSPKLTIPFFRARQRLLRSRQGSTSRTAREPPGEAGRHARSRAGWGPGGWK